jgi:hypothetical protein
MSEENKRLVREITEVVWNRRGLNRIPEFYASDFVGDYRPYALRQGHEGVRAMVEGPGQRFRTITRKFTNSSPKAIGLWFI